MAKKKPKKLTTGSKQSRGQTQSTKRRQTQGPTAAAQPPDRPARADGPTTARVEMVRLVRYAIGSRRRITRLTCFLIVLAVLVAAILRLVPQAPAAQPAVIPAVITTATAAQQDGQA